MNAEIVMVGSELLLGQIIDTNSAYLAQELARIGVNLFYKTTVGDNRRRMADVLQAALRRSDIIITSGGIGPTEDDLTREVVAEVVGQPLEFHQELFDQIETLFRRHGFTMSENNRKQAFIPRNATPIENPVGTAPGFICEREGAVIISLPGVPRELKFLMQTVIVPFLRKRFSLGELNISSRVLKICGMGESRVDARVGDLLRESANPTLGILAEPAQILLRITAKAETVSEARSKIAAMEEEIRGRFGLLVFGTDEETLEGVVDDLLKAQQKTLAVLETLTGGAITQRFVSLRSPALKEATVVNCEDSMRRFADAELQKWAELGRRHALLSGKLARAARARAGSDLGLASVGVLPESDTLVEEERSSGKTCIAISSDAGEVYWEFRFAGTDLMNQTRAVAVSLEMLRRHLVGYIDSEFPPRHIGESND
ncbi:MAG: competence/damage-inducible protein A [Candidatus Abyssubacteria bacterium]